LFANRGLRTIGRMSNPPRKAIVLGPGEGRAYPMGRISAVFKADGEETAAGYSISECWLEPHTKGPGAHSHPEDDIFYVLAGTMSVLVGKEWTHAAAGSFVLIPGGVTHDFENRGDVRAGVLNFYAPGTFEEHMPEIARWWRDNPPKELAPREPESAEIA
jgi:mannose-6-phosphate isomerase-like protein (cupin superfamily)